ncbi:septal ring lytic transglycosylase RlpA family protein [Pontibacterium sp.]|uniref:septal ring lytic transglycosylase RlpA family protein n=1 Tax=Pontibacterium sp. TaxID=2036026 RepID=UPI00356A5E0D
MKRILILLPLILLVGCSSGGGGRYSIKQDHGPSQAVDVSHVKDAVPRAEPKSRGGNKSPYVVFGKRYYILDSAQGYKQRGGASWYGKKFHGHATSNGEKYDMYAMTAAHKSLPIPTYVRVTNLKNGRQVIVRVNDRGPFHQGRIIDLSYAAASKLDMLRSGTAQVEVEAIDPRSWQRSSSVIAAAPPVLPVRSAPNVRVPVRATTAEASKPVGVSGSYLQVGAYSNRIAAERVTATVRALTGQKVVIRNLDRGDRVLYRVQVGPVSSDTQVRDLIGQLERSGYPDTHLVDLD